MPEEIKTVSFSITKNMIKLVQDAETGIVPQEGDKEYGDEWVKNKGFNKINSKVQELRNLLR